jgi:hypothetical protein
MAGVDAQGFTLDAAQAAQQRAVGIFVSNARRRVNRLGNLSLSCAADK